MNSSISHISKSNQTIWIKKKWCKKSQEFFPKKSEHLENCQFEVLKVFISGPKSKKFINANSHLGLRFFVEPPGCGWPHEWFSLPAKKKTENHRFFFSRDRDPQTHQCRGLWPRLKASETSRHPGSGGSKPQEKLPETSWLVNDGILFIPYITGSKSQRSWESWGDGWKKTTTLRGLVSNNLKGMNE